MEALREKMGVISGLILSLLNGLAGLGLVLPQGADAEGVALVNGAVIAIGLVVVHFMKPKAAPAPAPEDAA